MAHALDALRRPGRGAATLLASLLVVAIGYLDYATGVELRVYPLYFVPISLAALRGGGRPALLLAALSAAAWSLANAAAGRSYSRPETLAFNTGAQLASFSFVAVLMARLRRQLDQERRTSRLDALTGVANRLAFFEAAAVELARSRRYGHVLSLVYVDIDDLKALNDAWGHRRGDDALRRVAAELKAAVRQIDTVARLGGDEFALLLPETDADGTAAVLEKLRRAGVAAPDLRFSIGAVTWCRLPEAVEDLVARADALMYDVKRAGKNSTRHEVIGEASRSRSVTGG